MVRYIEDELMKLIWQPFTSFFEGKESRNFISASCSYFGGVLRLQFEF